MTAHPDAYLWGSLFEAWSYLMRPEKAVLCKAKRDEMFDEIEKLAAHTQAPSAPRIIGYVV